VFARGTTLINRFPQNAGMPELKTVHSEPLTVAGRHVYKAHGAFKHAVPGAARDVVIRRACTIPGSLLD